MSEFIAGAIFGGWAMFVSISFVGLAFLTRERSRSSDQEGK